MKPSILILLALSVSFIIGCGGGSGPGTNADSAAVAAAVVYTCPMHPSVISDRPGACPVCGMALVKKAAAQALSQQETSNLQEVALSPTQRVLANISTAPAARRMLSKDITLVGIVEAAESHTATVSARFRGRIERLFVNYTGERVEKGQP
ncbi:MAG: heavy metal-binding domain-containing protein, partial [Bacteroidota bacterium]